MHPNDIIIYLAILLQVGVDDKRQIAVLLAIILSRMLVIPQILPVYLGKTEACHLPCDVSYWVGCVA